MAPGWVQTNAASSFARKLISSNEKRCRWKLVGVKNNAGLGQPGPAFRFIGNITCEDSEMLREICSSMQRVLCLMSEKS
jgi:hypothetical protein